MGNVYELKSPTLHCEFCRETGALVKLTAPEMGWAILDRPKLGLSFRLMVPLNEELRNNDVLGEKQKLHSVKEAADSLTFTWRNITSERGGEHPIDVTIRVAVEDRQIVYYTHIENRSQYTVEAVHVPYVGDVRPPHSPDKEVEWFKSFTCNYGSYSEHRLWPHFDNQHGYYGTDYPTQMSARVPSNPFYLMRSPDKGLYAGVKANSSEMVAWNMELRPGWDSSISWERPRVDEIAGKPVHTRFAAVHMPYILPGESRSLSPIALEAFKGSWHAGADIYKKWRDTWFTPAPTQEWAKKPHSWQQLHINSPEDELRMRFTELPKVAEECKKHGVAAIQLVGWNDGGQDQGNPSHSPDPRLGTWDELKDAIAKCHEIGVKVILFSKFVWADRGTDEFWDEYIDLAVTDPYGDYYLYGGYRYFTPAQLLDINTKRLIPMCFRSEEFMKICEKEFMKMVDLGAAGMLYDECFHHTPSWLCFHPDHGHRYGAPVYANDVEFIHRLRKLPGVPKDFMMAGEALLDWQFGSYEVSYFRSENKWHLPLSRYLQPKGLHMTAITGYNDRNMVNQCLLAQYVISYEPLNFKGRLSDYPDTVEYGKKMDALRTEYRKWFWDGEYRDVLGAKVIFEDEKGEEKAHHPYSVFKAADGSLGVAIANYEDKAVKVMLLADDGQAFKQYRTVDNPELMDAGGWIEIAPRSAVIAI
ncbi:MAG: DUF6259 domain-containing protein [Defluviitaleaceae bacterium]|nr:DUF6259 domain-containing protein [Defluviitaleaceae bacterium]